MANDVGASRERTALAWQRSALALLGGAAVIARLTFDRLGLFALVALAVVMSLSAWVLLAGRGRYADDDGTPPRALSRGGGAAAALAAATLIIALVELAAIAR